jgi:hypothetical protein
MTGHRATMGLVSLSVAVVGCGGALYAAVRWAAVWDARQPREAILATFMSGFPSWVQSPQAVAWASIEACAVAGGAALLARRSLDGKLRGAASVVLGLAVLLGAWNLFTLM